MHPAWILAIEHDSNANSECSLVSRELSLAKLCIERPNPSQEQFQEPILPIGRLTGALAARRWRCIPVSALPEDKTASGSELMPLAAGYRP